MMIFRFNMLKIIDNSNLLDITSGIVAHGCNAQGVMGSGVARQLRAKYPQIFISYQRHLKWIKTDILGTVDFVSISTNLWVANMITQQFYGRSPGHQYVDYHAISTAISSALQFAELKGVDLHIPYMVGAGLGGGDIAHITEICEECSRTVGRNIYCHRL
jgi:O-acetyl-ADP-ribose deacetylase (regulator of RNase III)